MIDPDRDLYAIPSQDGNDIYFLSLVDILTHYGNNNTSVISIVASGSQIEIFAGQCPLIIRRIQFMIFRNIRI